MIARLTTALGLLLLTALSILRVARTPTPVSAAAPDTVFSSERALRHVLEIARRPHPMGTAEHDRVRDYILAQLGALGIAHEVQTTTAVGTRYRSAGRVQNILGYLPGARSNGKAVLLVVHYDGVEAGPAAADDGAGVGALLETLRALCALRADNASLANDVIALFTDGEEAGLLGAAAFVREHPRAKDVAIALNFEARGTTGRSFMFETGPGNLDAVRALRAAGDVTAGSVFTTIYRVLPNDTDLSELSVLQVPALNFAFADGVERYHTTHDDVAHLNPGSVQHHGLQMLALAKKFGNEPLPRPRTGDAIFFDAPFLGLIVYPVWIAKLLGILIAVLLLGSSRGAVGASLRGAAVLLAVVVVCGVAASFIRLSGPALWSGWWAAVLTLAAVGVNLAVCLALERRRPESPRAGALLVWSGLGIGLSFAAPAVSYPFVWPALFALIAERSRRIAAEWIVAIVALMMLAGFAYTATVVMLGVAGAGAVAIVVLPSLLVWLLMPLLQRVFRDWRAALTAFVSAAVVIALLATRTVEASADHPVRSSLVYAQRADQGDAFFGSQSMGDAWTRGALGDVARGPAWTTRIGSSVQSLFGRAVPSAGLAAPTASLVSDSTTAGLRQLVVRLDAPRGNTAVVARVSGVKVRAAAIDGRVVDTARFRRSSSDWTTEYWNVPVEGVLLSLTIGAGERLALEIAARRPGLPAAFSPPVRPEHVVASQSGDVSVVYRSVRY